MLTVIFSTGYQFQVNGNHFDGNKIFYNADFAAGKPLNVSTSHLIATLPIGADCVIVSTSEIIPPTVNISDAIELLSRAKENITDKQIQKLEKLIQAKKREDKQ